MLKDKLSRFSRQINSPNKADFAEQEYDRYKLAQKSLGGQICELSAGTFLELAANFDAGYRHGEFSLGDVIESGNPKTAHFYKNGDHDTIDVRKLLFFDMETTGLGGSGTVPFLIGFGSLVDGQFQVRQYFLPDYPDEAAMLEAVREEIDRDTIIVSYNGKAFDMPILTDRLILHRVEYHLEFADHIDLLHAARRMFRRRLQSCTLGNIERNVLSFYRYDDIPGELVPAVYFNWLNTMETRELVRVIEHNLNDIVSLYFLMHHISAAQENPAERVLEAEDIYSLARIFESRKEHDRVHLMIEDCLDTVMRSNRLDILFMQALACKRIGHFERAVEIWLNIVQSSGPETFGAMVELAKYYEHRVRDYGRALEISRQAESLCPATPYLRADLNKRIERLKRKLSR
jgi:uncharacterized protein YprB with RNaseH-like and TPR domain